MTISETNRRQIMSIVVAQRRLSPLVIRAGYSLARFAFPLLALALTGVPAITGIVAALGFLPFVLLSLFAGALADRWNRKRMMIITDAIRTLSLGSIPFAALIGHLAINQFGILSSPNIPNSIAVALLLV